MDTANSDLSPAAPTVESSPPLTFAALPLAALDYSHDEAGDFAAARPAMVALLWLAVLSGLCVASCFLVMGTSFHPVTVGLHVLIYAVTLGLGVVAGIRMTQAPALPLQSPVRTVLDAIAGIGLLILGAAPLFIDVHRNTGSATWALVGGAFLIMSATTYRHLLLYGSLAMAIRPTGFRTLATSLHTLGVFKMIYEGFWLLCCATPLGAALPHSITRGLEGLAGFAVVIALFGCLGYGVIWILMMIAHVRLVSVASGGTALAASQDVWNTPQTTP